jgi:hypothetical protein
MPVNGSYEAVLVMVNLALWLAFFAVFLFVIASFGTIIVRMFIRTIREELDRKPPAEEDRGREGDARNRD